MNRITVWKSTGTHNYSSNSNMAPTTDANNQLPELKNDGRMHVYLNGNYFVQNRVIIYCVYQLDPISSNTDIQFKMLYLEPYKLLKKLMPQNMLTKDMTYVLMKVVCLVKGLLTTEGTY